MRVPFSLALLILCFSRPALAGGGGGLFFQHMHERFQHCHGAVSKKRNVASGETSEEKVGVRGEYARILFEGIGAEGQVEFKSKRGLAGVRRTSDKGWCERISGAAVSYECSFQLEFVPDEAE
jgi:hypothetical protein